MVKVPVPGVPVRGSVSGRPIMAAMDLLGRRWAMRVLWELAEAPAGFRDLQARCGGISASVLSARLRELGEARIVETDAAGKWALSGLGRSLVRVLRSLRSWAEGWEATLHG